MLELPAAESCPALKLFSLINTLVPGHVPPVALIFTPKPFIPPLPVIYSNLLLLTTCEVVLRESRVTMAEPFCYLVWWMLRKVFHIADTFPTFGLTMMPLAHGPVK